MVKYQSAIWLVLGCYCGLVYLRRVIDDLLDETFPEHLPAVALEGAKGVGKTMTASQRCRTVLEMERFAAGPEVTAEVLAAFESPVLLDEWQRAPAVWDVVRRMVDRQEPTRVLLTGSATPPASVALHSGAGRIESFLMRPLSWFERRGGGEVSLGELWMGGR